MAILEHGQEGIFASFQAEKKLRIRVNIRFSNGRLKILLERVMKPAVDLGYLDSPPCLPVADASGLADLAREFCLSCELGRRRRRWPIECQELQSKNVLGVVLNAVDKKHSNSSYYGPDGHAGEPIVDNDESGRSVCSPSLRPPNRSPHRLPVALKPGIQRNRAPYKARNGAYSCLLPNPLILWGLEFHF